MKRIIAMFAMLAVACSSSFSYVKPVASGASAADSNNGAAARGGERRPPEERAAAANTPQGRGGAAALRKAQAELKDAIQNTYFINVRSSKPVKKNGVYVKEIKAGEDSYKGEENRGAYVWADGTMYLGNFYANTLASYGMVIAAEGKSVNNCPGARYYAGEWKKNKKTQGRLYDDAGRCIYAPEEDEDNFKMDKPKFEYPDSSAGSAYRFGAQDLGGGTYIGETFNGKASGYGALVMKDGTLWIGEWKDGARAGQGILIPKQSAVLVGMWDGDQFSPETSAADRHKLKEHDKQVASETRKARWRTIGWWTVGILTVAGAVSGAILAAMGEEVPAHAMPNKIIDSPAR